MPQPLDAPAERESIRAGKEEAQRLAGLTSDTGFMHMLGRAIQDFEEAELFLDSKKFEDPDRAMRMATSLISLSNARIKEVREVLEQHPNAI